MSEWVIADFIKFIKIGHKPLNSWLISMFLGSFWWTNLWGCGYRYHIDWVLIADTVPTGLSMLLPTYGHVHIKHVPGLCRINVLGVTKSLKYQWWYLQDMQTWMNSQMHPAGTYRCNKSFRDVSNIQKEYPGVHTDALSLYKIFGELNCM